MLPMQTSPRTFPATRMTKRSLNPWPNSISVGTRASEQPTTTANGVCLGIWPNVRFMPTSRPLHCTTYCGSPLETVAASGNYPSSARTSGCRPQAFCGLPPHREEGGFTLGLLGSNR